MEDSNFLELINRVSDGVTELRRKLLGELDSDGVDELADAHAIIALNLLSQAQQNLKLAKIHQMRAMARK